MSNQSKPNLEIYTDGACSGNPGPGGWGALLIFKDNRKEIFGHHAETTNNQMELQAAISALKSLKKPCRIKLYTDSKYVQKGITEWIHNWVKNSWRKSDNQPVKNAELWKKLQQEMKKHDIIWHWVKGHSDNNGNNVADRLAVEGREVAKRELENVIRK
jgi:ribonuclease HI